MFGICHVWDMTSNPNWTGVQGSGRKRQAKNQDIVHRAAQQLESAEEEEYISASMLDWGSVGSAMFGICHKWDMISNPNWTGAQGSGRKRQAKNQDIVHRAAQQLEAAEEYISASMLDWGSVGYVISGI